MTTKLYKRKNGIFYAEMIVEGERINRSTKERNKNKAAITAARWLTGGIPEATGKKSLSVIADFKSPMDLYSIGGH